MRIFPLAIVLAPSIGYAEATLGPPIPDPENEIEAIASERAAARERAARPNTNPVAPEKHALRAGIAVNPPLGWFTREKSMGVSAYVAPTKRNVIRANLARYWWPANQLPALLLQEESEGIYKGAITDVGVSWMFFFRKAFDGLSVEVGLVHRSTRGSRIESSEDLTDTTYIAGRALVGWNWSIRDRVFMSFHLGMSKGHASGTTTHCSYSCDEDAMPEVTRVDEWRDEIEGFWRIGVAFDL